MITEKAVNCALKAIEDSGFSYIEISTQTMKRFDLFQIENFEIDVTTVSQFIPEFMEVFDRDT